MDKNKIADVLEDAARLCRDEKVGWCLGADLYESEQVEWYSGSWVKTQVRLSLESEVVTPVLSMCVEGALMAAAGLNNGAIRLRNNAPAVDP